MSKARIRIGIGGWTFPEWRGLYYPPGMPHAKEQAYAASKFGAIEINSTFYSRQSAGSWAKWGAAAPDGFQYAIKGSRFIVTRPKLADAVQGTTIGVLMSATLPARLGEPSRALIVARRLGRARDRLPVVLGTIVSQTLINVFALVILGAVMFITIGLFAGKQQALLWYALAPIGLLLVVLVAPALMRSGRPTRPSSATRSGASRARSSSRRTAWASRS